MVSTAFPLYLEAPTDLATIYNVTPLYNASKPITGKGQTVVVLEDTDINSADVATFRKAFGLTSYSGTFAQIHPGTGCSDPGMNNAEGRSGSRCRMGWGSRAGCIGRIGFLRRYRD